MRYWHTFRDLASLAEVAEFHASAASLKAVAPPLIPMRVQHAAERMRHGDEMGCTMCMGPLPVHWEARVEDVSPTGFRGRQIHGPFKTWAHRHRSVRLVEGWTEMLDEVEASLKQHGLWGLLALAMWPDLPSLLAFRVWTTWRLLEGDAV
jgi:hypothetical protein